MCWVASPKEYIIAHIGTKVNTLQLLFANPFVFIMNRDVLWCCEKLLQTFIWTCKSKKIAINSLNRELPQKKEKRKLYHNCKRCRKCKKTHLTTRIKVAVGSLLLPAKSQHFFVNPILHTAWLDYHDLTLKIKAAKNYFGEKSSFLHTFLKNFCESRKLSFFQCYACFLKIINLNVWQPAMTCSSGSEAITY